MAGSLTHPGMRGERVPGTGDDKGEETVLLAHFNV
jgi:hypothetical protein